MTASAKIDNDEAEQVDLSSELRVCAFGNIEQLRRDGALCDVRIHCKENGADRFFYAHKLVLAAIVPFFNAYAYRKAVLRLAVKVCSMFNSDLVEQNARDVQIWGAAQLFQVRADERRF